MTIHIPTRFESEQGFIGDGNPMIERSTEIGVIGDHYGMFGDLEIKNKRGSFSSGARKKQPNQSKRSNSVQSRVKKLETKDLEVVGFNHIQSIQYCDMIASQLAQKQTRGQLSLQEKDLMNKCLKQK